MLEIKQSGTIQDVDYKTRTVTGYLSKFGNTDYDNDVIQKGAFSKTIAERMDRILFLSQHDWTRPLGKFSVLREDGLGLYFEADVVDTTYGNDLLKLYQSGVINEHSIGFETIKDIWEEGQPRILVELKLYEGSAVTRGANPETPFLGFKGLKPSKDLIQKFHDLLRSGTVTDETFQQVEIALKQFEAQIIKNHLKESEPGHSTLEDFEPIINTLNSLNLKL